MTPEDTNRNPVHLEFFRNEALSNPIDAVVREDIQNRLDAKSKSAGAAPVIIKTYFPSKENHIDGERKEVYLSKLIDHASANQHELNNLPSPNEPLGFMVIEDFNTHGLQGDPRRTDDPEPGTDIETRNDFYWFIRNVGRSGKGAGDRGRWGLGKIVYPASSRVRAFYTFTIREDDQRKLLTGRSVLDVHKIEDEKFESEGYYGEFSDHNYPYFCLPVEKESFIQQFQQDFKLSRINEPGLSIIIPYPNNELKAGTYIESIISSYFMEIHDGKLEVHVRTDEKSIRIARDTLREVINAGAESSTFHKSILISLLDFCGRITRIDMTSSGYHILNTKDGNLAPKLREDSFNDEDLDDIKTAFHNGQLLWFAVQVNVQKESENTIHSNVYSIFIEKDDTLQEAQEIFIRDGLTISGQSFLKTKGVRALVLIDGGDDGEKGGCPQLSELLGDAENPAHTQWLENTKHFRNKYKNGASILRLVKRGASDIVRIISQKDESRDENLLEEIFSIPIPGEESDNRPVRKKKKRKLEEIDPPDAPADRGFPAFEINKIQGGFHLQHNPNKESIDGTINIRLAYETVKGNPFSRYSTPDFNVKNKTEDEFYFAGCKLLACDENRLHIGDLQKGFSVKMTGFDIKRDLIIKAEFRKAEENDSQL